jgi:hypothetical protein
VSVIELPDEAQDPRGRGWIVIVTGLAATALAAVAAPSATDPASLAQYFASVAQISATLLVAIALFQGALGDPLAVSVRRWIGPMAFIFLGIATIAATAGTVAALPAWSYRWLFAFSAGPGLAGLMTVLAMGWTNISVQRQRSAARRAAELAAAAQSCCCCTSVRDANEPVKK